MNELSPSEAKVLIKCWINDSLNRYGRVNYSDPIYCKLKAMSKFPDKCRLCPGKELNVCDKCSLLEYWKTI